MNVHKHKLHAHSTGTHFEYSQTNHNIKYKSYMIVEIDMFLYNGLFSAATFVSHVLQYKMSPSVENISPN
jgi:hypothetical protein